MKDWFKRVFLHSLVKYIIIAVVAIIIVLGNLIMNGFSHYVTYIDGVQVAGVAILFMGGLSLIGHYGAFDFWGYTFSRKQMDGRRIDISEYLEQKRLRKKSKNLPFPPYFLVGTILLLISFVMILFK